MPCHLQVLPSSSLLLSIPFRDNCGGRRLNQYTVTMEVKWTRPPPAASDALPQPPRRGCFAFGGPGDQPPDPSSATWAQLEGVDSTPAEDTAASYWPLFAVASVPSSLSAAARADMKVSRAEAKSLQTGGHRAHACTIFISYCCIQQLEIEV